MTTGHAYRTGYLDGLKNVLRRGKLLYMAFGASWKAYENGYKNGEKQRKK